uniref:Uncharacterized protein n=2 Tax=Meloidogyne TaxID=189290 RepID=A0A6V7VVH0_MELEN|nr:unnamed protein product [Meloidogyne enterolobii]
MEKESRQKDVCGRRLRLKINCLHLNGTSNKIFVTTNTKLNQNLVVSNMNLMTSRLKFFTLKSSSKHLYSCQFILQDFSEIRSSKNLRI